MEIRAVTIPRALGASMIAGVIATGLVYLLAPFFGERLGDFPALVARALGAQSAAGDVFVLGLLAFFAAAAVWGLLYSPTREAVPGPDWVVGMGYGLAVWVVGYFLLLPAIGILPGAGSLSLSLSVHLGFGLALALAGRGRLFAGR